MSRYIKLEDIYLSNDSPLVRTGFTFKWDKFDELEFCMGLKRGEILTLTETPLHKASMHADMVPLLREGRWALVPSRKTLKKILKFYHSNHECRTRDRKRFNEVIPLKKTYEYDFVCHDLPEGQQIRVAGDLEPYTYPLKNFPTVRSRLHPCFLITSAISIMTAGYPVAEVLNLLGDRFRLLSNLNLALHHPVTVKFLGSTNTRTDFPERRIPVARRDRRDLKRIVSTKSEDMDCELSPSSADNAPHITPTRKSKPGKKVVIVIPSAANSTSETSGSKPSSGKALKSALKSSSSMSDAKTGQKRKAPGSDTIDERPARRRSLRLASARDS